MTPTIKEKLDLTALRDALPQRYGSIISKRLAAKEADLPEGKKLNITSRQVRLIFYEDITDPTLALPVFEEAHKLHEEGKRVAELKTAAVR